MRNVAFIRAFATEDGRLLWRERLRAGINACPAVVGDTLIVGAGIRAVRADRHREVVAYRLP